MSPIELFITWTFGFVILALLAYTLYQVKTKDRKVIATIVPDNSNIVEVLNDLKGTIIKKSDDLRNPKIDELTEKHNLNANVGVRVGLSMAIDIINDQIKKLEKDNKEYPVLGYIATPGKENKNKREYSFDSVAKAMFGDDVK